MKTTKQIFDIRNRFILCICMVAFVSLCATVYTVISSYDTKSKSLSTDNFSNFYTVADNKIQKFDRDGKYLVNYSEVKYGKIGMLDVSNPMKLTVYYPDFMVAVTLDRFLSPLTMYNFFDLGYQNISAAGSSSDGRLWFYDNLNFTLKKIDETGKVYREGQPLNVLIEEVINPNFIIERNNNVYVNDPKIGILVFDIFGSYNKTIPLKGLRKFQVYQDQIVYFEEGKLKSYNTFSFESKMITLPDTSDVIQAVIEKERIVLLKKEQVVFYKF